MTKEMEKCIDQYWDEDRHDKIVEMIMAVPEEERDIDMLGQLVVAYNNLQRYDDAINLSMELKAESEEIPAWYYRIGYAYVKKHEYEKAADYLETGIGLANQKGKIDNAKNCQMLYEKCIPHLSKSREGRKIEQLVKRNQVNLNDYQKAIFVQGITETELLEKIKQYEEIASGGGRKAAVKLRYFALDEDRIYIEYVYAKDFEGWNFWHYQNLLLWLADGKQDNFCFAYKESFTEQEAFYAQANIADRRGASVVGIFKGAKFYYEVPGFYLDWMSEEGKCMLKSDFLYSRHHIDVDLLEDKKKGEGKEVELIISD